MFELIENAFRSKTFWITAIFVVFYLYFKKVVYSYWERHGVPHQKPTIPFGNLETKFLLQKLSLGNLLRNSYEKFKHHPYHGMFMFHNRLLMVNDPELIKQILVKEFASFPDRGLYCNEKLDPLNNHLFFMNGDKWRIIRAKLSPTFTSGKLKHMFPLLTEIADEMINVCDQEFLKSDIFDMKDIVARYTTDTIFSLAFGFNCNSLKDPRNQFRQYGDLSVKNSPLRNALGFFAPSVLETFHLPLINPEVSHFFMKLFPDMVEKRRTEKSNRKDFLNLLIELIDHEQILDKESKSFSESNGISADKIARKLRMGEATAQAFVFFVAGFETSSSVVTHCLYELALNPEVQQKLHEVIDEHIEKHGSLNYEAFSGEMEYLDMVFLEAMRMHPSLPFLNRICIKDYQIPDSNYCIPEGMPIIISVSGLHRDAKIYPNPDKFDPTRFNKENTAARHPYAYLPFGEGPRICIGKRLGQLQSKICLFSLLSNYKFSVCEKTPIPNQYTLSSILQTPTDIYLRVEKRKH